jgi:hypothetical protein
MTHSNPPTLLSLAPELLDSILLHSLSGPPQTNHLHLERLQLVCKAAGVAARYVPVFESEQQEVRTRRMRGELMRCFE